jgi:hypothetical protein
MEESIQAPFSGSELRTIVEIAHSPTIIKNLVKEVKDLKRSLKSNPDILWEDYKDQVAVENGDILKSTLDRFQSNRKATQYWQKL